MFTDEAIKARLRENPFRPVRIIASEGLSYEVYHPDLIWVGWSDVQIGFASPDHPTSYDRTIRIAMSHIVALEDIPVQSSPTKNGPSQ